MWTHEPARRGGTLAITLGVSLLGACASPREPRDARLQADVEWLAHPARAGRRAGPPGELAAAEFVAARLAALGLDPGGEEGYYQRFPVPLPARQGGGSYLILRELVPEGGETARRIERAVPFAFSAGARAEGPVCFRGYGIQDDERGWLDYGAGDSAPLPLNAIALVIDGAPAGLTDSTERPLPTPLEKALEARRRGAIAVLFAEHPATLGGPRRFESQLTSDIGLPALWIDADTARLLVPEYDHRVAELDRRRRHAEPTPEVFAKVDVSADVHRDMGAGANVLGLLRGGSGPAVIIAAHIDHLGVGGPGVLDPEAGDVLRPGADDNASGVAVALEVARALANRGEPPEGDVLFAFFSGEELGRLGSEAWLASPSLPLSRVGLCIDVDAVGRAGDGRLSVLGVGTSPTLPGWMPALGERASLRLELAHSTRGLGGGDHQGFLAREVPVLHLFSGPAPEHHRASDDATRFEPQGAAKVATLVLELVGRVQARERLEFTRPPSPTDVGEQGYPVRFGAVRQLDHVGAGLALESVTRDSPAERAGLSAGDVLVEAGGMPIDAMHDFLAFLQMHKPADVVRVRFRRDGSEHETLLTLEARPGVETPSESGPPGPKPDALPRGVPEEVIDRDLEMRP